MPQIKHRTYIRLEPQKVFETLTTAEGWNAWFTDRTTIDWSGQKTGKIQFRWKSRACKGEEIEDGGEIQGVVPDRKFKFQWTPGQRPTTITFTLHPYEEGTVVLVEETGYSKSRTDLEACVDCAVGWGEALTLLKFYLEHGVVYKEDLLLDAII